MYLFIIADAPGVVSTTTYKISYNHCNYKYLACILISTKERYLPLITYIWGMATYLQRLTHGYITLAHLPSLLLPYTP